MDKISGYNNGWIRIVDELPDESCISVHIVLGHHQLICLWDDENQLFLNEEGHPFTHQDKITHWRKYKPFLMPLF